MKKVAILVPEKSVLQAIADPQYCLSAVNQFLSASGRKALFDVQLVGAKKEVLLGDGKFTVHTDKLLQPQERYDIVFVPALFGNMKDAIDANKELIPWILEQYRLGADVASLCMGAFLLAATDLLNGKKCSTHWNFVNEFREMFPEVKVQDGRIVTEEERLYSSGGAHSYWNLLLHLVEKYTDHETAVLTAKYFAVDIDRSSQAAFTIFKGQKFHNDEVIKKAQEYIEQNFSEKISVETVADKVAMGRRNFERRFKQATNNSVLEYIQRIKIEAAKRRFETTEKNINEVMYDVGYADIKAFRSTFKKVTGLTPLEYRNKYNKLMQN